MQNEIFQALEVLRQKTPLVHNITNDVVTNNTANALLALGASPIMSRSLDEMEDMVTIINALVINTGTITSDSFDSMILAAKTASALNKPWILDPVGAGATPFRFKEQSTLTDIQSHCRSGKCFGNQSTVYRSQWRQRC